MSFWSFWNGKEVAATPLPPEPLGVIAVLTAGKWEQYVFIGGSLNVWEGQLRFTHPHFGCSGFAPGIWSVYQTFPLSKECQAHIREFYKTRVYDSLIEEKIKSGVL